MTDLGNYQLGQTVPLTLVVRDSLGRSALPDVIPTVAIYDANYDAVFAANPYPSDPQGSPSVFAYPLKLGSAYVLGKFFVVFRYSVGGVSNLTLQTFTVVGGGDAGGNMISLYSLDRPEARYVLGQLSGGSLVQGRKPHF
jgi:hypothetical protein